MQELFGAEFALPRVVVIDEAQKKQIFRTSQTMSNEELVGVLEKYRDGAAAVKEPVAPPVQWMQSAIPQDCPACRRAAMLRAASGLSY